MKRYKKIVVKVGTKVITSSDRALDKNRIKKIVDQIVSLKSRGITVILVTSGAIGAGMAHLGLVRRPRKLPLLQAAASVGQHHLMNLYADYFKEKGFEVGQLLLTRDDFSDRKRYIAIKHTLGTLLSRGVVPIINENDAVSTEEIKFGDNDALASLVGDLAGADLLMLMTDVEGLLDGASLRIPRVDDIDAPILKLARSSACDFGSGGMLSKLNAARRATQAGLSCVIVDGRTDDILLHAVEGEDVGTVFVSKKAKVIAKKRWIAFSSKPRGVIYVDDGASRALSEENRSLLASGIVSSEGAFNAGDVVRISKNNYVEIGRGVSNYSRGDIEKIKGLRTTDMRAILGYKCRDEVIHKDNLVIT